MSGPEPDAWLVECRVNGEWRRYTVGLDPWIPDSVDYRRVPLYRTPSSTPASGEWAPFGWYVMARGDHPGTFMFRRPDRSIAAGHDVVALYAGSPAPGSGAREADAWIDPFDARPLEPGTARLNVPLRSQRDDIATIPVYFGPPHPCSGRRTCSDASTATSRSPERRRGSTSGTA